MLMPEICRFGGSSSTCIQTTICRPHFHAKYGGEEAQMSIRDCAVIRGRISPRAERQVVAWVKQRTAELERAWEQVQRHKDPGRIAPPR